MKNKWENDEFFMKYLWKVCGAFLRKNNGLNLGVLHLEDVLLCYRAKLGEKTTISLITARRGVALQSTHKANFGFFILGAPNPV